ncbi:MAG: SDR family oxidoreductase [Planctomycetes bacterium]|nr:SDR family oxidoreductase [Planctomycetota bacterium]
MKTSTDPIGLLTGRVAAVMGGAGGMGLATSAALLAEGASVLIGDVQVSAGEVAAREFAASCGGRVVFQPVDVARTEQVQAAIDGAVQIWGGLDILVNIVGINIVKPVEQTTEEDFARVVETNLRGTFAAIRAAVPHLRRRGGGSILSIGSVHGDLGFGDHVLYTMTKAGLNGMTKELAFTLGPDRIRVNVIAPGYLATHKGAKEMARTIRPDALDEFWRDWADLYPVGYAFTQPLRRACQGEDVAHLAVFLASDRARFLTGEVIHLDGGLSISMFQSPGRKDYVEARQECEARWKAWYQAHKRT